MSRAIRFAPLLLLAVALAAEAAAPAVSSRPAAKQEADQLDFLFLASDRPVLIRLHLRAGDKPYGAVWEAFMDKLFAWFDKDNDGFLSKEETARLMLPQNLSQQLEGGIGVADNQTAPFTALDTNKDGKVSKEEFRAYYRTGNVLPLRYSVNNVQARTAKQTNDSIYRRLGRASKAKLSKADVAKLPTLLDKCDSDEDEMLTVAELNTDGDGQSIYAEFQVPRGMMRGPAPDTGLTQITATTNVAVLVDLVMKRYDANRDGKLAPGENGLDREFVASLDADKDGKLSAQEMAAYFFRQPEVVLRARVGPLDGGLTGILSKVGVLNKTPRAEIVNQAKLPAALAKKVKKVDGDNLSLELGDARFDVKATEGSKAANRFQGIKNFVLQQFDAMDAKKVGYLERPKEKIDPNDFATQAVFGLFTQADKNADGKLHRKELEEWLNLMEDGSSAFVALSVTDSGRSLFELLDVNRDGKLSIRELRTAWARLEPLCKGNEGLAQEDLPRSFQVTTHQGNPNQRELAFFFNQGNRVTPKLPSVRGVPAWFTRMDRNGDGDVSQKEWLGSEEKFREIDTDGDGLISVEEAKTYEAKKSKK